MVNKDGNSVQNDASAPAELTDNPDLEGTLPVPSADEIGLTIDKGNAQTPQVGSVAQNIPTSVISEPFVEAELAQNSEITTDSSRELIASVKDEKENTNSGEAASDEVLQPAPVHDSYLAPEWPGSLLGRVPPPIPFLSKPRLGKSSEEIVDFPDTIIDSYIHGTVGHAMCISTRGDGKRHFGTSRQDSCAIALVDSHGSSGSEISFLVVADGVGSADMSHFAAKLATRTAIDTLTILSDSNEVWEVQSREVFKEVAERLEAYSKANVIDIKRLITTLRIAKVVPNPNSGTAMVSVANIGDGATLHLGSDGNLKDLPNAKDEESLQVLSPTTKALPYHADAFECSQFVIQSGEAVVLATDGALGVWNAGVPLGHLIVGNPPEMLNVAWALDVRARGHVDDRTIAFWCQG